MSTNKAADLTIIQGSKVAVIIRTGSDVVVTLVSGHEKGFSFPDEAVADDFARKVSEGMTNDKCLTISGKP